MGLHEQRRCAGGTERDVGIQQRVAAVAEDVDAVGQVHAEIQAIVRHARAGDGAPVGCIRLGDRRGGRAVVPSEDP